MRQTADDYICMRRLMLLSEAALLAFGFSPGNQTRISSSDLLWSEESV